jgi:hypothetical protein
MSLVKDFLLKAWEFIHALFFTRDDDLDILQVLFAAIIIVTLAVTWKAINILEVGDVVKIEALITLRWLSALLVITAVPKWLVPWIGSVVRSKISNNSESNFIGNVSSPEPLEEPTDRPHRFADD